jgi:hypothetical protein
MPMSCAVTETRGGGGVGVGEGALVVGSGAGAGSARPAGWNAPVAASVAIRQTTAAIATDGVWAGAARPHRHSPIRTRAPRRDGAM